MVLDGPAAGLDPYQQLRLRDLLSTIDAEATVVVSTHMIDEAAAISSQVVVIAEGHTRFSETAVGLTSLAEGRV